LARILTHPAIAAARQDLARATHFDPRSGKYRHHPTAASATSASATSARNSGTHEAVSPILATDVHDSED
jgi:hypothetical protein